jgi:predicted nucleic acid-binding protein
VGDHWRGLATEDFIRMVDGRVVLTGRTRATALTSNCERLFSENMQHSMVVENRLRIVNLFQN